MLPGSCAPTIFFEPIIVSEPQSLTWTLLTWLSKVAHKYSILVIILQLLQFIPEEWWIQPTSDTTYDNIPLSLISSAWNHAYALMGKMRVKLIFLQWQERLRYQRDFCLLVLLSRVGKKRNSNVHPIPHILPPTRFAWSCSSFQMESLLGNLVDYFMGTRNFHTEPKAYCF